MHISGANLVNGEAVPGSGPAFHGVRADTGEALEPQFREAGAEQIAAAASAADAAFREFSRTSPAVRAGFLRAIADEILALGDALIARASAETALPAARLENERGRTTSQLRMFADLLDEGSWVEARIDPGDPARTPVPRPDLRRMLVPLGPVAVFGASNFPLAFSVPGGDTASAFAAGCTVVFKAHPAHPGTSELAAGAILRAARTAGIPSGVFSLVHGWSHDVGLALVRHPLITAVGFTGSLRGGRALCDAAAARPSPIPVYAEMGSINPVFLLPSALRERGAAIARALAQSITLGVGQFCTSPGVLLGVRGPALDQLQNALAAHIAAAQPGVMLYDRLAAAYTSAIERAREHGAAQVPGTAEAQEAGRGVSSPSSPAMDAAAQGEATQTVRRVKPVLLAIDAERFARDATLREERFGPVSILVTADDAAGLERAAAALEGQLTASIHGTPADLLAHTRLIEILQRKAGRLIFNGVPTGVEVGHAMQHGGPWPASSDARSTSVGSAAITRFARPVCFQDFPGAALPPALRNHNALGIWRLVNGQLSRNDVT